MTESIAGFKQAALVNTLRSCQLFQGLALADLQAIAALAVIKPLSKGDYLFRQGDPSQGFYIVQSGSINVHRVNAVGKEQVIHVFRAGESFAEGTLATDAGYPADARAVESSQVLLVQKPGFLALLRRQPELALRMLGSMSAHLLKRCPDPAATRPARIELTMAKRVLAAEMGTVSETLSRTFARLRDEGLITVKGRTITIVSPADLAALLRQRLGD
jgi:CRP-like cAMP-binding protein